MILPFFCHGKTAKRISESSFVVSIALTLRALTIAFAALLLASGPAQADDSGQNTEWDVVEIDIADVFDPALLSEQEPSTPFLDPVYALYRIGDTSTKAITSGGTALDYVMVSLPVEAHRWVLAQLNADLGGYNPSLWRIFRYNPDSEAYDECDDIQDIRPGLGYWVISGSKFTLSLDGWCTTEAYTYPLTLEPGWNQIGNPFEEPIAWADVEAYDSLGEDIVYAGVLSRDNTVTGRTLWAYDGKGEYVSSSSLRPFEGYWIKNHTDHEVLLLIPSPLADRPSDGSISEVPDGQEDLPPPPPGGFGDLSPLGGGGCFISTGMYR